MYALCAVADGADASMSNGHQAVRLRGLEILARTGVRFHIPTILEQWPDLAPAADSRLLPLFVAAKEAGL